jgi:uncharacterized metal-binding protein YceD (DUF177 family)
MSTSKAYTIQFASLAIGEHQFEMDVNDPFFEDFEFSEIKQGSVKVKINLLKQSTMMVLEIELGGMVKANCDRCAAEFDLAISGNYRLVVKTSGEQNSVGEEDDDIIAVSASESKLDLSQHLYEYLVLSLPIKREHSSIEDCDKEVLGKLNNFLVEDNSNSQKPFDPRWDDLTKIKLN